MGKNSKRDMTLLAELIHVRLSGFWRWKGIAFPKRR